MEKYFFILKKNQPTFSPHIVSIISKKIAHHIKQPVCDISHQFFYGQGIYQFFAKKNPCDFIIETCSDYDIEIQPLDQIRSLGEIRNILNAQVRDDAIFLTNAGGFCEVVDWPNIWGLTFGIIWPRDFCTKMIASDQFQMLLQTKDDQEARSLLKDGLIQESSIEDLTWPKLLEQTTSKQDFDVYADIIFSGSWKRYRLSQKDAYYDAEEMLDSSSRPNFCRLLKKIDQNTMHAKKSHTWKQYLADSEHLTINLFFDHSKMYDRYMTWLCHLWLLNDSISQQEE
jgi:hypothetical protein